MSLAFTLAGRTVEAADGTDLLSACLGAGVEVPHFCWHAALGSVGACRLCAVHVTRPGGSARLEMACTTAVEAGLVVEPDHPEAVRFREGIIELLLAPHPHDCAVCEAGGACDLQDMAAATGHFRRRVTEPKRHHARQDIGPFLTHEMNRCIACYRCSRFYRGVAGGRDFAVFGSQARVWFGRASPGPLESPFAGNLAELCPTGVFNDRAWSEAYARPWDMEQTPAVCSRCAVGCNLTLFTRDGRLRKAEARVNARVNGHFLCDRGRFGVHAVHALDRARGPAPLEEARRRLARGAIGLGSPNATLEANLALREFVGPERFHAGEADGELRLHRRMLFHLGRTPARRASLADLATADTVLLLALDPVAEAPLAALRLREAGRTAARALARQKGVPLFLDEAVRTAGEGRKTPFLIVAPQATALDDLATGTWRLPPPGMAAFVQGIVAALAGRDAGADAVEVARTLRAAEAPVVVVTAGVGRGDVVDAAAAVAAALGPAAGLAFFPGQANAFGLALLGPAGGIGAALARAQASGLPLLALEPDGLPATGSPVVRLDWLAAGPGLLLPVAAPEETSGLFVNFEGRAQESWAAVPARAPDGPAMLAALGGTAPLSPAALRAALAALLPGLDPAPPAAMAPRAPPGLSGRTADDRAGRLVGAVPSLPGTNLPPAPEAPAGWLLDLAGVAGEPVADPPAAVAPEVEAVPATDAFISGARDLASPLLAARRRAGVTARPAPALHPDTAGALGLVAGARILAGERMVAGGLVLDPELAPGVVRLERADMPAGAGAVVVRPAR